MGLGNNTTIVSIVGGKFTVRLDDNDDNPLAVERELTKGPNAGKVVKELQYRTLDGHIIGGEMHKSEYGVTIHLKLDDGNSRFILQVPLESQYFGQIVKRLPNVNPSESVMFGLGFDKQKGKSFLYMKQNKANVPFHYTRETPNGLPEAVKRPNGKWDFSAQEDFLYERAVEFLSQFDSSMQPQNNDDLMDDRPPLPQSAPADIGPDGTPDDGSDILF